MHPSEEHILLKALQGDSLTPEEHRALSAQQDAFENYTELLQAFDAQQEESEFIQAIPNWKDVVERSGRTERKRFLKKMMAAAAVLIVMMGINWFIGLNRHVRHEQLIVTNKTPKEFIHPQNHSRILLEPGSRLAVLNDHQFSLHGEAHFDVPPQTKPLLIHSGDVVVKVIGTKFHINAQTSSSRYELQLESGKLEVTFRDDVWILNGGEALLIDKKQKKGKVEKAMSSRDAGLIEFKSMTLDQIVAELERHYHITVKTELLPGNERYTVQLPDGNATQALEILAGVCGAKLLVSDEGKYLLKP